MRSYKMIARQQLLSRARPVSVAYADRRVPVETARKVEFTVIRAEQDVIETRGGAEEGVR